MSENNSGVGDTLLVLLLGAAAGAAAGFLLAPQKGKETRRRIRRWLDAIEDDLREEGFDEVLERGKDIVREQAQAVRGKVESAVREKASAVKEKVDDVIKDAFRQGRDRDQRGQ